ncbi:PREDICTED: guanine nucleotide-binding protein alpha-4 subunit-like [Priapulus caudatus]|uniref:Guanine nucleotide-binding protein alpha-4 subunit-like n=1 Tax=Priapulus caudatus TaxID=37621 RepID=A0ABM1EDC5_PRICU|nr:PREDICTED: guanine nucleotide-binding protein alpha-4 subunit-like [Priapulus caudatus]
MNKCNKLATLRSRSIDHDLDHEREKRAREVQLLILGAAGSGKSTFTKQLRIHYGDGYPTDERAKYTPYVFDNMCEALLTILRNMKTCNISFQSDEMQCFHRFIGPPLKKRIA